ncbi:esterase E4-like isoform X2 [Eriocheir sinensis]|uniref:esterase E4-like isoform X2 n=1 Tax=Eriocheir sinensis TaxID=95602 RepID=UPI0021C6DFAB|nr:esterase E4-like isoform X2 [Eriocheir sinensis]
MAPWHCAGPPSRPWAVLLVVGVVLVGGGAGVTWEKKGGGSNVTQEPLPSKEQPRGARILTGREQQEKVRRPVELSTSLGVIAGVQELTEQPSRPFFSFRGIPFAEPPVGRLRWTEPKETSGQWTGGYLDATQYRPFCPQFDPDARQVLGQEDCLYLNVHTPLLPNRTPTKLPVLVFLHGGGYLMGAASALGPHKLLKEDVILVTVNYRLGALGFLSTRDSTLPGNYGALDQIAALKWIRSYIAQFGGDPTRVTLGGFSSGASLVHLHLLSPLSKDLFTSAIMMSGSANCMWSVASYPEDAAYDLASDLDCSSTTVYNMKECLLDKTVEEIVRAQACKHRYVYWPMLYRPVVDAGFRDNPFLPEPVENLMTRPPQRPAVPLLLGGVPKEGLLYALTALVFSEGGRSAGELYDEAALYTVESLWPNTSTAADVAEIAASFYYSSHARRDLNVLAEEMTEAFTDLLYTSCIWDAAQHYAANARTPVYTYLMEHHDPASPSYTAPLFLPAEGAGVGRTALLSGASHGDDLALLFSLPYRLGSPGPRDLQMSMLLTGMWAAFVQTGSPHGRDTRPLPPWEPLSPGEPVLYYRLSFTPAMSFTPFRNKEQNLWRQTLRHVDSSSEVSYAFTVATWVLLALVVLLLVVVVVVCVSVWVVRRQDQYPSGSLTLRQRISRNPSITTYNG